MVQRLSFGVVVHLASRPLFTWQADRYSLGKPTVIHLASQPLFTWQADRCSLGKLSVAHLQGAIFLAFLQ